MKTTHRALRLSSPLRLALLCGVSCCGLLAAHGQTPPAVSPAEETWQRLRQFESDRKEPKATPARRPDDAPLPFAADYVAQADELKEFRRQNPQDARVGEARRLEAVMLLRAWSAGAPVDERCDALVTEVRQDASLPADARYALASAADLRAPIRQPFASHAARLARFDQVVRALRKEFPTVPAAYEALLNLAKSSDDHSAAQLARDLVKFDATPADVRAGAQILLDRHALLGESLPALLAAALAPADRPALPADRLIILYPWATWNEAALFRAKEIAALAPPGATILGVNLDADPALAREAARTHGLPGVQLYAPLSAPVARSLALTHDPLVYLTNARGKITTVSAHLNLAEALATSAQ